MARKKRPAADPQEAAALETLLAQVQTPEQLEAVFRRLKQRMVERVLQAELTEHLGYAPGAGRGPDGNARNGTTPKTVLTDEGALPLAIPRDREGSFTPAFVPKGVRRLPGFDQKVLSLYARGLTVRELQAHLEECYQVEVSPAVITAVTDAVLAEAAAWQQRPLEPVYIAVVLDGLRVKIRTEGLVQQQVIYLALGIRPSGEKEVLGFWLAAAEGAAFWQRVLSDLQGRGVQDILIALVDGLPGFPDAIHAVFPQTVVHQCVVHLVRQSLAQVNWRERKAVASALRGSPGPGTFGDHGAVAAALGAAGPGAGVPGAGPAAALLDQRDREPAPDAAEEPQGAGALPLRGGGEQTAVPGAAERAGEARHAAALGGGAAAHPAPLRGPGPGMAVNQAHTQRN